MSPAIQAAATAVRAAAPQALRFAGYTAVMTAVSYSTWKFNKEVIDPMVEKVSGKIVDAWIRHNDRVSARELARFDRRVDREIARRRAQGTLQEEVVHTRAATARRRAEAASAATSEPEATTTAEPHE